MIYLDDLKYMKLYKKPFMLPINKEDKKHGSAILLLTPNYESSNSLMNHSLALNKPVTTFQSYYVEKDIMYTINNESRHLEIAHTDYSTIINEQPSVFIETTDIVNREPLDESSINEFYCKLGDHIIFFNEMYDENIYNEVAGLNSKYKKLLYYDRIRNNKEVFNIYKKVKEDNPWIKKTFVSYDRYNKLNLYIDLSYYNQVYLGNNSFTINKSIDMYFEFIRRFINDRRIDAAGYTKKTVFIPIDGWKYDNTKSTVYDYMKTLNPLSVFHKKIRLAQDDLHVFDNIDFIFLGNNGYFKFNPLQEECMDFRKYIRFINVLQSNEVINDDDAPNNSSDAITADIVDKIEKSKGIKIHNLTGETQSKDEEEKLKAELVSKVKNAAKDSADEEETLDVMDKDPELKRILSDLADQSDDGVRLSATRLNRINKAQDELMNKKINGKSIRELINDSNKPKELPEKALPIKTINEEWKHLKGVNFEKEYDLNADIMKCLNSLSDTNKKFPVSILNVDIEDASTSEDSIVNYIVKCEDYSGKRFTLQFYIPKFRENRFMRLRGNEKEFTGELPLLPISKTDEDTVQIATFYNKIFISRYYTSTGKSNPYTDRFIKALNKYSGKNIKVVLGDNSKICAKYDLPIDYIDLSSKFSKITYYSKFLNDDVTIYFNQDEIRSIDGFDSSKGIPIACSSKGQFMYYNDKDNITLSEKLVGIIEDEEFIKIYEQTKPGKKYTYSRASILNTKIPVIVILAHDIGLTKALNLAGIKYEISDKKSKAVGEDYIKFADGYINYPMTYSSMMLLNGLKDCDTENIKLSIINNKQTWVDELENFGGRIKSDGLDNFADLMYDPISVEVSKDYKLPENYHEALIYANNLLADNKYANHIDLSTNRYRTNEVVAAQFYRVMASSYKDYALQNKRGRNAKMFIPQNAVLDLILSQNTTSDLSVFQPLSEVETRNSVSTKGVTGMNTERAYGIDKRGFDNSMLNSIAAVTGFASTVGINRQMTIDPGIIGGRGYFKKPNIDDVSITKTLSITEALSPFMTTSDDPFRNNMTFVQTSKHSTPIEYSSPQLVTTGADAAMPYLVSDMFCHKAKKSGTVKEITDDYLLVEYNDGTTEYVNLAEQTMKNSDGGFYITLQLKTDLKVGSKVKQDTILAYDKKSFSNRVGDGKQIAYNIGCLSKVAILTTEDGFEDSGMCSEWLTKTMSSDIVVEKGINLPASTNILYIAKKGQAVTEGDPILIFQNAYDEEDANLLLKQLNNEDGDVSEIGRNIIKSKVTGIISDIKVYRTVEKDELSESLKKIVSKQESEVNRLKKIADKAENEVQFNPAGKLPAVGKLKAVDGVLIEIYMKYNDQMSVGDKITINNANKEVLMDTFQDEEAPYTDFRPTEKIDIIGSASAIDGRIITSPMKLGALNKCMIELSRAVDEIMGVKWKTLHEIRETDKK